MHDPVSKVSMHGMLNSIISECIWGSITIPDNNNNESLTILPVDSWKLYSTIPSRIPPSDNLLTYGEFLETRTLLERHEKKALKTTFTEPGKVGEECRQYYEKCLNHLCPSNTSPCYHILPSFFKLLKTLRERQLDYRIIFRTFGTDTNAVVEEYNSFCRGDHPLFPHSMDMSQHILPPNSIARIRRSHDEVTLQFHNSNQNSVNTHPSIHGVKNIYHFLYHQMTTSTHAFSIQDDFSYWDLCSERDDSGKLLLIDRNHEGKDIIQIFFDDNIERDRAHIVDVRDISSNSNSNSSNELSDDKQGSYTGLPIPFTESNNKYLCRVSPFDAITDEDYYVKEFDLISNSRESEHTHHNHHNNKL